MRNPVVEHLAMICTLLAISEQDPEVNELPPIARLASSLQTAASPDSVTLGGLKSEITECRRRSAGDARPVDKVEYSTFSQDSA